MTTNSFLPASEPEAPSGGGRRTVLIAGGLVAALALGGGGYYLLAGSSSAAPTAAAPIVFPHHVAPKAPAKAAPAKKSAVTRVVIPAVYKLPIARDPFTPLYVAPVAAPVGPVAPAAPAPATGTPTSAGPAGPAAPPAPVTHTLVLTKVYGTGADRTAVFTIDGRTQLAKVGSVFGPTSELKLLSLSQNSKGFWVATTQVGDGEPFDAQQYEKVYVN